MTSILHFIYTHTHIHYLTHTHTLFHSPTPSTRSRTRVQICPREMTQNGVACNKLRIRSVVRNFQLCALLLLLLFLLLLPLLHRHPFGGFATLHWNAPGGHRTGLLACAANECASMRMTMATSIGLGLGFSVFRLVFAMCHVGGEAGGGSCSFRCSSCAFR